MQDVKQQDEKSVAAGAWGGAGRTGGGGIMSAGLFSSSCKCSRTISPGGRAWRVCVQSPGAPISQLINFIFTHLFLNVLSDGNAAGRRSEVLTRQTGLKRGSEPVSEAAFQFKVAGSSFFYYSLKVIQGERTSCLISAACLKQNALDRFGAQPLSLRHLGFFFFLFFFSFFGEKGEIFLMRLFCKSFLEKREKQFECIYFANPFETSGQIYSLLVILPQFSWTSKFSTLVTSCFLCDLFSPGLCFWYLRQTDHTNPILLHHTADDCSTVR